MDRDTISEVYEPIFTNLNCHGTLEDAPPHIYPVYSVQYHPEAAPGPHDAVYLFGEFIRSVVGEAR